MIHVPYQDTSLLCADSGSSQERGAVELTLLYDAPVRSMTVHVLQARGLQQKNPPQILQSQVSFVFCGEAHLGTNLIQLVKR